MYRSLTHLLLIILMVHTGEGEHQASVQESSRPGHGRGSVPDAHPKEGIVHLQDSGRRHKVHRSAHRYDAHIHVHANRFGETTRIYSK